MCPTKSFREIKILLGLKLNKTNDSICKSLSGKYKIRCAQNAEETYNSIHKWGPDIAILDYKLAGTHPIDLYDAVSFIHGNVYFVLCVTLENYEVARRVWKRRALDYIFKPIHPKRFIADIEKVIRYVINKYELSEARQKIKQLEEKIAHQNTWRKKK